MNRKVANPIIKDEVTFLQTASESGGSITKLEILLMPGGKNPMHYHRSYSEKFTAITGELGLRIGRNKRKILQPGESLTVQPGQVHCFYNPGSTAIKFLVELTPGHEGFENSVRIAYGLSSDAFANKKTNPINLTQTGILLVMGDMGIPGIAGVMTPFFKLLAKIAKANGDEKRLIEKYCR